jgi:hypothetical protein
MRGGYVGLAVSINQDGITTLYGYKPAEYDEKE